MIYTKPNSVEIRKLIKGVQKGDEDSCEKLYDIIDELANTNIILIDKLKKISTICTK